MKLDEFEAFSARVDETLAFLPGDYTPPEYGGCFRCQDYTKLRPSGLCTPCAEFLSMKTDVDPIEERERRMAAAADIWGRF